VVVEAVRVCVQGLSSYRTAAVLLSERLGRSISPFTLNGWVDETGSRAMTPVQVSARLAPPDWSGVLGVDGKAIWVAGEERCLLIAVDQGTQDVVHALVVRSEDEASFERIVRETVTVAGYPLKALVIDAAQPFVGSHLKYFARLPMQLCRIHASRRLDWEVRRARRQPDAPLRAELKARLRDVLFASNEPLARERYAALSVDYARYSGLGYKRVDPIRAVGRRLDHYLMHHRVPGLPADSNITENVIKQLAKKLRLMEGFSSTASAERFTRLLIGCYRFKRFTSSCRPPHNGRAPLELAGIDLDRLDWIRFHLGEQHST
jgi:transposase-like protein